jgi:hypothetical protein
MLSATSRLTVARAEALLGGLLALLGVANCAWCSWSLPRYGVETAHGLETAVCNWGTGILTLLCIGMGVSILVLGLFALWRRAAHWSWWACQIAIGAVVGYIALLIVE